MIQPDLLSWTPPAILGDRAGETFDAKRDGKRLNAQAAHVYRLMQDGKWRTLAEIAAATDHPEASVSARLRDFRKVGYVVDRQHVERGLWRYRLAT